MLKKYSMKFMSVYICYGISALAVFLANFVDIANDKQNSVLIIALGVLFWLGLIVGWFIYRSTSRIKVQARTMFMSGKYKPQKYCGIITFRKKLTHIALYTVIAVGIVLVFCEIILGFIPNEYLLFIIAVTYYAVLLHCVIDGENYNKYLFIKDGMNNETDV